MKYYSTKSLSKMLGVTSYTIRNWDKEGKLKPAYVKSNGYRYYSLDSVFFSRLQGKRKKNTKKIVDSFLKEIETEYSAKFEQIGKKYRNNIYKTL